MRYKKYRADSSKGEERIGEILNRQINIQNWDKIATGKLINILLEEYRKEKVPREITHKWGN